MENKQQELKEKRQELEKLFEQEKDFIQTKLNDTQIDFIEEYGDENCRIDNITYLDDSIMEYADSRVSVYTRDQVDFYWKNQDLCDNAFFETYGDFTGFQSIGDIVASAGVCGMIRECTNQLYENDALEELKFIQEGIEDILEGIEELESEE